MMSQPYQRAQKPWQAEYASPLPCEVQTNLLPMRNRVNPIRWAPRRPLPSPLYQHPDFRVITSKFKFTKSWCSLWLTPYASILATLPAALTAKKTLPETGAQTQKLLVSSTGLGSADTVIHIPYRKRVLSSMSQETQMKQNHRDW